MGEIIDMGVDFNIINKSGSWYSYGDTKLGQGRDAVKKLLFDNPELAEELEQKVREHIKGLDAEA
jgi:recombination protein RecA